MANEQDQADKALHAEADAGKRDLDTGVSRTVSKGDEAAPPEGPRDPFGDRKAIFKKANDQRDRGEQQLRQGNPDHDERMRRMEAEARGEDPYAQQQPAKVDKPADKPDDKGDVASSPEQGYVSLQYQGRELKVSKTDVARAGGEANYLRQLELDQREIEMTRRQRELEQRDREFQSRLAESQALRGDDRRGDPSDHGTDPATRAERTAAQNRNGSGDDGAVGIEEEANRLAQMIYSGDEGDIRDAVATILQRAASAGQRVDVEDVARRAARMASAVSGESPRQPAEPSQPAASGDEDPVAAVVRSQINKMASDDFPELLKNDVARQATFAKLQEMMRLPENKDRRAVDVARDACDWGMLQFFNPRGDVIERKRGLPSATATTGTEQQSTEDDVPSTQDFIALTQQRRRMTKAPG